AGEVRPQRVEPLDLRARVSPVAGPFLEHESRDLARRQPDGRAQVGADADFPQHDARRIALYLLRCEKIVDMHEAGRLQLAHPAHAVAEGPRIALYELVEQKSHVGESRTVRWTELVNEEYLGAGRSRNVACLLEDLFPAVGDERR